MDTFNPPRTQMKGIAAAPGLASGEAFVWQKQGLEIPRYSINDAPAELERLRLACAKAACEIEALRLQVEQEVGEAEAEVFDAHRMILDDISLIEIATQAIEERRQNAEAAWMDAIEYFAHEMEQIPDPTLSERAVDVRDVGRRVVGHLTGKTICSVPELTHPVVFVAQSLEPSETVSLNKKMILAFCTAEGGATAHTAILAKAMDIPAVVGLGPKVLETPCGCTVLVDGSEGILTVQPGHEEMQAFYTQRELEAQNNQFYLSQANQPALTLDGQRVEVVANIGGVEDAVKAFELGAEGVGLLRTEFLYLDRNTPPNEEEQVQAYQAVLDKMGQLPVVVRTLDAGGDKQLAYLNLKKEENPFLGLRAIRLCLQRPEMFKTQLRALLRAGRGHQLRIMLPMISTLDEVRTARTLIKEAQQELELKGQPYEKNIQYGMMVEIPSVVVMIEQFAREVDFFSIGTNDLTQYTFAAERTNDQVAYLGDAIHPAILRQIQKTIQAAHASGIWVGVCGELAGDPLAVPILLGLGLDEFSLSPSGIPHAKAVLRQWSVPRARLLAQEALKLESAQAVRALVEQAQPS